MDQVFRNNNFSKKLVFFFKLSKKIYRKKITSTSLDHNTFLPFKQNKTNLFCAVFIRLALYGLIGAFFIFIDPYSLGDKADDHFRDVIYKNFSDLLYEDMNAANDVAVVLIDEKTITSLHEQKLTAPNGEKTRILTANEWPITYSDHVKILSSIIEYEPKAIFVDIFFRQERSTDPSSETFLSSLKELSDLFGTTLVFAGGYPFSENLSSTQKTDFQNKVSTNFPTPFNGWEGKKNEYPLVINGENSAAYELFKIACSEQPILNSCKQSSISTDKLSERISLFWGKRHNKTDLECRKNLDNANMYEFSQGLIGEDSSGTCAYHDIYYADNVLAHHFNDDHNLENDYLTNAFKNKIIFYAVSLEGLHDHINSPVHGVLPGVFGHAMALDNLMSMGDGFIRSSDLDDDFQGLCVWLVISLLIIVLSIILKPWKQKIIVQGIFTWILSKILFFLISRGGLGFIFISVFSLYSLLVSNIEPTYIFTYIFSLLSSIKLIDKHLEPPKP